MSVTIDLTPQGLVDVQAVLVIFFRFLGGLARACGVATAASSANDSTPSAGRDGEPSDPAGASPPRWIWDEIAAIAEMRFRYAEKEEEIEYARRLAISMQSRYDPVHTLSGDALYSEWAPQSIVELLGKMHPLSMVAVLHARSGGENGFYGDSTEVTNLITSIGDARGETDAKTQDSRNESPSDSTPNRLIGAPQSQWEQEPWFGTRYRLRKLRRAQTAAWVDSYTGADQAPAIFSFPPPNPYIPTDFALRHPDAAKRGRARHERQDIGKPPPRAPPLLLRRDITDTSASAGCIFHCPDVGRWATPKGVICMEVQCVQEVNSVEGSLASTLAAKVTEIAHSHSMRVH